MEVGSHKFVVLYNNTLINVLHWEKMDQNTNLKIWIKSNLFAEVTFIRVLEYISFENRHQESGVFILLSGTRS